ncbi:phenylacetate--CoA ligase family protein [Alicyclobacillus dauci]|uniref:Phenylacetate-coenzyme A ligase n=1 Tax=Alicyclobacillus dauci TaxID=1475485 RepID=A0ABY6YX67_9BACL|nr:phenylacetate--CoA ligase [Alicyclobacillus dauci]WAH35175.1 phenylacetate--CoA ligase [Alicyclobacillus dauci]
MFQPDVETIPRETLTQLQINRLQKTVKLAYECVPFYRHRLDRLNIHPDDIRCLNDIVRLPFTCKQDLRDNYPFGLFAVNQKDVIRYHASSGTKGKPTVVGYTRHDVDVWAECVARAIVTAGGRPHDVFHVAYGYGLFTGGLGFHYGAERVPMTVVPVSGGNTTRQITLIEDFLPRGIAATPSYALNIAETMESMGKDPRKTSIDYGIFGAEPWSEEMRKQLEEKLGLKAIDVYGLSEVMGPGVGIECAEAQDGLHIVEDHFYVEVVDPQTGMPVPNGQLGELVFTTLTKEALPMIRYRTGDIAFLYPDPCRCGRTHVRMSRVKGRLDDMLIVRGVNVFPSEVEAVVLSNSQLSPYYQIIVDRSGTLDELSISVEVSESFIHQVGTFDVHHEAFRILHEELNEAIRHTLNVAASVTLCQPGTLPRSEGKAVRVVDKRKLYQA